MIPGQETRSQVPQLTANMPQLPCIPQQRWKIYLLRLSTFPFFFYSSLLVGALLSQPLQRLCQIILTPVLPCHQHLLTVFSHVS